MLKGLEPTSGADMNEDRRNPTVKSADRALAVVEFVAGKGSASFTEILEALAAPLQRTRTAEYSVFRGLAGPQQRTGSTRSG